jgi:hypothetical protein
MHSEVIETQQAFLYKNTDWHGRETRHDVAIFAQTIRYKTHGPSSAARQTGLNSTLQFASDCLEKFVVKLSTPFTIPTMNAGREDATPTFRSSIPLSNAPMATDNFSTIFFR